MVHVAYKVVRHEDGWAYTVNGVFSESFPTHEEAREAARRAAAPGRDFPTTPRARMRRMRAEALRNGTVSA